MGEQMPSLDSTEKVDSGSVEPLWHSISLDDIFSKLNSTSDGLSTEEVIRRRETYGENKLEGKKPRNPLLKLLDHFRDPMVYLLLFAAIIAFLADREDLGTPIFICIALTLNAVLSYIQEAKAEKAMDSLKKMLVCHCIVLRDGVEHRLSIEEVVPGDIVWLEDGLNVPADIRLIEVHQLSINESSLTGESDVVYKAVETCDEKSILQEMINMAFMGTVVSSGRGLGIVVKTGMGTKVGDIATGISEVETPKTPLEIKLGSLGRYLGMIAIISAVAIVGFTIIMAMVDGVSGADLKEVVAKQFLIAVAIFVAIVPEGLPIILVITLAIGMQNMSAKNAIVSRMKVVETLGSATIICTDKTGTLTRNEMSVRSFFCGDDLYSVSGSGFDPTYGKLKIGKKEINEQDFAELKVQKGFKLAMACSLLCQNSNIRKVDNEWKGIGNPTDIASAVFGWKMMESVDTFRRNHPRFKEYTFDRDRKRMTTIHEYEGERWVFSKGAIGPYLSRISHVVENGRVSPIGDVHRDRIGEVNLQMATQALRVIALTARPLSGEEDMEDVDSVESGLIFLGLIGIMDPPRQEVADAISMCDAAGVRVMMITGDQQMTAMAIGDEIGIIKDDSEFLTGKQLRELSDDELDSKLEKVVMFSRVTPDQKLRIVTRLQSIGHVVAMTGDGDNDAPALSRANIGIAMGIAGTDVARDAADMVLKDDNFSSIVDSIEEGRKIYLNIRNFVRYQISTNVAAVLLIIIATFVLGWRLPMTATQLLVINILMDGPPALALGIEKRHGDVMNEPPRALSESLPNSMDKRVISFLGTVMVLGTLSIFSLAGGGLVTGDACDGVDPESSPEFFLESGECNSEKWDNHAESKFEYARTMAFATFIMFQLFNVVNSRSIDHSAFELGIFQNIFISASFAISLVLLVSIVQSSFAFVPMVGISVGSFLSTIPLKFTDWAVVFLIASSVFWIEEFRKFMLKFKRTNN